jgi:hypothetical protein
MKKVVFILSNFLLSLNSFGNDIDSILIKAIDEISIVTLQYYVLENDKTNAHVNIYTSDSSYKNNKIDMNLQKQKNELKEQIQLPKQENTNLSKSLPNYKNSKLELKSEGNFFAYAFWVVVFLFSVVFAWNHKKKIWQIFKNAMPNYSKENINIHKTKENSFKDIIESKDFVMDDKANINDLPSSKQNDNPISIANSKIVPKGNWFVVGSSVRGKSHIEGNIPCQDFNYFEKINDFWGIAVSCDGAGSADNSHVGSKFVAMESVEIFKNIFLKEQLDKNNELPHNDVWHELAKAGLYQVKQNLVNFAKSEGFKIESLACTVILSLYSPYGILVTHIGDGRAGFMTIDNEWKPMLTPWKGEEANQTVFITSAIWNENIDNYVESTIIREQPLAFTLMSDGCEAHSFECSVFNKEMNEWHDPNLPFPKFFNPLVESLIKMKSTSTTDDDVQQKWENFLSSGTPSLINEPDDKTLILGVFISENN